MKRYVLKAVCPERMGTVHATSQFIVEQGGTIVEASSYADIEQEKFFMRWEVMSGVDQKELPTLEELASAFTPLATSLEMEWELVDANVKPKILIAVSKFGHCLNDLLYRWQERDLPGEIVGVISNHEKFKEKVEWYQLPFYHLPVTPENKPQQEQALLSIMQAHEVDLLVLARYMQILSDDLCQQIAGKAINIHHSFLPSFKGAKPYKQAYDRGVKIMGATAHYVTDQLDEGPIIEQDVQRIDHSHSSKEMSRLGTNIETAVLARAVRWHCEHRIIIDNKRTIVFK